MSGKTLQLKGQIFEKLKVLSDAILKPRRGKDSHKNSSWFLCRCDCGNQVEVKGINLKAGRVKSCGCLQIKKAAQIMKHDSVFDLSCECSLCDPDMAFKCKGCLLESVPYCLGQDDDYFYYCTPCWCQLLENLVTVVVR